MKNLLIKLFLSGAIILMLAGCQSQKSDHQKMIDFGVEYTAAWNSKVPANMASYYAEDGSLTVNNGTPAVGRDELAELAKSFMEAFPDMKLTMDSLVADADTYRYYWTFTGTNTGSGGTGNKVNFSGFERWTMNKEGLIQKSIGTFDENEYNRQLSRNTPLTTD
ncbi:MAG: nuclear transport factor 2 family protein [Cyclobacteriaceae bacterium]|nr:nuclear transport factor 2 family protein [Cyclobacteriaceae bacterium]